MSEKSLFWGVLGKVAIVVVFGICFAAGGTEGMGGLWVRRYLGAAILTGGLYWFSRDWKCLLTFPLLAAGMCFGYGADTTGLKVILRAGWGLMTGTASAITDLTNKRWLLAGLQIALVTAFCIILGVWNGLPSAVVEQFAIGCAIAFLPVMSARPKEG